LTEDVCAAARTHRSAAARLSGIMSNSGKAPTMMVWIIALVLYAVALVAHFGLVRIGAPIATWSWIIGFGLLLLACRVRGL